MPKVQKSAKLCACGNIINKFQRVEHWQSCEPFRQACADELTRIHTEQGKVSSKTWNEQKADNMPSTTSLVNTFNSWVKFLTWAGVSADIATYKCICGYSTSSPRDSGQHNKDCVEYRVWLIDELERIYHEIEHEPNSVEWNEYRADGYPRAETITTVWPTWIAFQGEVLRRERMDKVYVDETLPTDGLAVSSVRTVGKEVFYMLR